MDISSLRFDPSIINSLEIRANEKDILIRMLKKDNPNEMELIAKGMVKTDSKYLNDTGPLNNDIFFNQIKCEVFKFICTSNKRYASERNSIQRGLKETISIIATAIAAPLGIGPAILTGIIAAILMVMMKVGKNAWCKVNQNICN